MILLKNATVVTQNKKRQIINNGAVLIDGERIKDVGENSFILKKYRRTAKKTIDARGRVIIPGLINLHTHAAMALLRGYADDLPLKIWLEEKIWPAEAGLKPEDVCRGSNIAIEEMLASGTAAFNDMYWYPEETMRAGHASGIRYFGGPILLDFNDGGDPKNAENLFKKFRREKNSLARLTLSAHAIYTVCEKNLKWAADFARENNLFLHMHVSETENEVKECLKKNNLRPVEYLYKLGLLGEKTILAHCVWLSKKEIEILAETGTHAAHCPASNMKLASGTAPLPELLKAGVNVGLGTDSPASNNSLDMFSEMKIAALIHKVKRMDPAVVPAQTVLDMATINGAKALGTEKETGTIEKGKKADLAVLNFTSPHLRPLNSVVSHLVYSCRGSDVEITTVNGRIAYYNRGKSGLPRR